jgi:hypothetical protein
LFPQPPVIDFRCPQKACCERPLKVPKTQVKRVVSLAGVFIARRILQRCEHCGRVFEDPALRRWVGHRCNTAWDVLVFAERILILVDRLPRLLESLPGKNAVGNRLFFT